jgi:hypothetical protein
MNDLLTLADIAKMFRCTETRAKEEIVRIPGFPEPVHFSTPRNKRWLRKEVRAFLPLVREAKAAVKRAKDDAFLAKCAAIDARSAANRRHHGSKRRTAKLLRTPPWADMAAIQQVYREAIRIEKETGVDQHVDHIYPLQGRLVSGLHVHNNLRVIPKLENIRKSNRYEVAP